MKHFKKLLALAILFTGEIINAQSPSFYDLTFQPDSVTSPYKTSSSNYAYVRSKRGTDGVNPTSSADSVKTFSISKIVLVFSEENADALANREEYNQERWENLILTYPEFFQAKTTYKNVCQCSAEAGGDEFKQVQGFYIYYVPKGGAPAPKKAETPVVKAETPAADPPAKKQEPAKKEEPVQTKAAEPVVKSEPVKEKEVVKEPETPVATETKEENTPVASESGSKKKGAAPVVKPRRAKDPKACRPACYGYGDDDLNAFFKDNIKLNKKQKRKASKATVEVKIQLNFDGSIKKTMAIGENEEINKLVTDAIKSMNNWNASVKGGIAIKSEVKITLKFDKESKSLKATEVINSPRLGPKCKCASDSEIFGD